ncbi:glycosyltransferase family 2 protein [Betaproteobacteria bacterium SCN2]|jgi:glycosyltransferase involved in cell wall biosynthesis|nr:glycosyltransferase family 2 protein [Betaproteobacteria bacterium SCN2]
MQARAPNIVSMSGRELRVSAVMPCLNEEKTLGLCIEKIQRAFAELGVAGEVVVADNGSTDRSVEIAESLGARVVHEPRKGYGAALLAGITSARGRIVIMADADDSYDWAALGDFVRKIEEGYDLVMGNRFKGGIEPGAMPPLHRYLGNPVLSTLARVMYRIPINDFHCGMRAFTRDAFERMNVRTAGMEFATEMVVSAAHAGLRITEIPTRLYPDKRDRPPHLRSFRDGWRHLRFILTYAPDWLYLIPGGLLFLFGMAGMAALASGPAQIGGFSFGIHFLALASLFTLLGANIIGFALLARLINAGRKPIRQRSAFGRMLDWFTLERGLIIGGLFAAAGLAADAWLLAEWLASGFGDMENTVHLAFVATTIMLLGVNAIFASFLFNMLREEHLE